MNIQILHEDKDYVVVNKPSGLVVHSDGRTEEPTLVDWILERYPGMEAVGEPMTIRGKAEKPQEEALPEDGDGESENTPVADTTRILPRPGIVHRLDRDTSGVLLIAKNQKAFLHAKLQFQNRLTKKTYHTFVYGRVKEDTDEINRPIGRSKNDFRLWSAMRGTKGEMRDALTYYKVLSRCTIDGNNFSYLEVRPLTGRTHQIRVHLKAINYPVVSDTLYAPRLVVKYPHALGFERLALHARTLEIKDMAGKKLSIEAPFPEDFEKAIKICSKSNEILLNK